MQLYRIALLILVFALTSCKKESKQASSQNKINIELKNKLESILLKDQGIREIVNGSLTIDRKIELLTKLNLSETDIKGNKRFDLMRKIDSVNILEVEKIITKYGYPNKSLVGEPANKTVFYVVQHSNTISTYLPIIREAAKNGDISTTSLAMMEDRNLMEQGVEQLYGTQIKGQANKRGKWIYFLWPVKNIDSVNILREQMGFELSLEEYLKEMDIEFKLYKIDELKDL